MNRVQVEIGANVTGFKQGMQDATQSAQQYETETRRIADAQVNLMKEYKAAKREVYNLAAGYAKLDDEAKKQRVGTFVSTITFSQQASQNYEQISSQQQSQEQQLQRK